MESKNENAVHIKKLMGYNTRTKATPIDAKILIEWEWNHYKYKFIIGLALLDSQLHLVDLQKSAIEIWEQLSNLFGEKSLNAKFYLKLLLFRIKIYDETSISSHIINRMSLITQLV